VQELVTFQDVEDYEIVTISVIVSQLFRRDKKKGI